ncbi:MAG: LuxR C-terminal-related transcriptional regulator [Phycisphaerae bacterium]
MGRSQRLRLTDVARLMRLQGELCELVAFSDEWKHHLMSRLMAMIGADFSNVAEGGNVRPKATPFTTRVLSRGNEDARRSLYAWLENGLVPHNPLLDAMMRVPRRVFTCRRVELVEDRIWYRSDIVRDVFRADRIDDSLNACCRLDDRGGVFGIGLHRAWGDRPFDERDRLMVHLLFAELLRQHARRLRRPTMERPLSRRQRQVLERLMTGKSEKQIAFELRLARSTVHEYVTALHRRFDVCSRGELLAKVFTSPASTGVSSVVGEGMAPPESEERRS